MSAWAAVAQAAVSAAGQYSQYRGNRRNMKTDQAWRRQMRQTAYQDTMGDMRKAGLNPMLAYMKGDTPTPSGSSASGGVDPSAGVADAVTAYQNRKLQAAQVGKMKAETEAIEISNTIQRDFGTSIPGRIMDTGSKMGTAFQEWLKKKFESRKQTKDRRKSGKYRDKKGVERWKKGEKRVDPLAERFKNKNKKSRFHKGWDKFWNRKKGHHGK